MIVVGFVAGASVGIFAVELMRFGFGSNTSNGTRVVLEARPQDPLGGDGSAIRLGWRPQDSIVLTR